MGKYSPLQSFLADHSAQEVPMTFEEIEKLVGGALPPVALKHRAWWSNNPSNNVMTKAWLNAGYKTARVDMDGHKLVFVRVGEDNPKVSAAYISPPKGFLVRLRAALAGTLKIADGADLTQPSGEIWDAEKQI